MTQSYFSCMFEYVALLDMFKTSLMSSMMYRYVSLHEDAEAENTKFLDDNEVLLSGKQQPLNNAA